MNPIAANLNQIIKYENPQLFASLSRLGKDLFFPRGIPSQGAEAKEKAHRINATIGIAKEAGHTMRLDSVNDLILPLRPSEALTYASSYGIEPLRKLWQEMLVIKNPSLKDRRISLPLVTNGITHGVSTTADLWIDPDDLVLVPEMMWGNYRMIFEVKKQAQLATYPVFNAAGKFDLEGFERAVVNAAKPRTKIMVILNSPHNPSGYAFSESEGEKIVKILIAVANSGCHVVAVCDDAYFGLFYDPNSLQESLFARLTGTHPNLTAIKLDGGTKENYVWGLRVGFITFGSQTVSDTPALYDALAQKGAGCIRGTISNDSHLSQSIVLKSMQDKRFSQETKAKFELLKARAAKVGEVLQDPKFKDAWTPYPFNAGYFMCVKLKDVDAETLRLHLLDQYGVGVISLGKTDIRVAFSCLDIDEIPTIFDLLLQGVMDLRKSGKTV